MPTSVIIMEGATAKTSRPVLATSDPGIVDAVKRLLWERIGLPGPRLVKRGEPVDDGTPRVQPEGP